MGIKESGERTKYGGTSMRADMGDKRKWSGDKEWGHTWEDESEKYSSTVKN